MDDLSWCEVGEPEYIQKILAALESFSTYLRTTNQLKLQGGILTFDLFRSENEVASRTYRKETLDNGEEERRLVDITTVGQYFPEYCKDLREGKWLLFWASIDDFRDMPLRIFKRLQQAFKENDCADLLNKLIEATEYAQEAIIRKLEEMGR